MVISAAVTFILTSRLPDRAHDIADLLPVEARLIARKSSLQVVPLDITIKTVKVVYLREALRVVRGLC